MKPKTIVRIIGIFVLSVAFLVIHYTNVDNTASRQQGMLIFFGLIIIGFVMIVQLKGLKNLAKSNCQCCDCQNCDRNHNHWTHRGGDSRRHPSN